MATYTFNSNVSDTIESDMLSASKTISDLLSQQASDIQSALSDWVDGAADGYQDRRREWEQIAANMPAKLQFMKSVLEQMNQNYQLTTKQGVSTWSGYSPK